MFPLIHSVDYIRCRCGRSDCHREVTPDPCSILPARPTFYPMLSIDDAALSALETRYSAGLSSSDLIEVCAQNGIHLSEASLRKYVQLGLLPRSVRVGQKGKHKGSKGMYPARTIRQLVRIKGMMSQSWTIEQIRRDFLFVRSDIEQLEETLSRVYGILLQVMKQKNQHASDSLAQRDVREAKRLSRELLGRLTTVENRLAAAAHMAEGAKAS